MMNISKPITGRHVLIAILIFFGVIIVANTIFVSFALNSFPGESEKKSYLQGLHYNDALAERSLQEGLGWRTEITHITSTEGGAVIELRIFDGADRPLNGLAIDGELRRPTHHRDDQLISFVPISSGVYQALPEELSLGAWDLTATAVNNGGDRFDFRSRVVVE